LNASEEVNRAHSSLRLPCSSSYGSLYPKNKRANKCLIYINLHVVVSKFKKHNFWSVRMLHGLKCAHGYNTALHIVIEHGTSWDFFETKEVMKMDIEKWILSRRRSVQLIRLNWMRWITRYGDFWKRQLVRSHTRQLNRWSELWWRPEMKKSRWSGWIRLSMNSRND
jgi:hypothetical protein